MNMNMKNEKTMLALVLVAALAMVSVAGVALASESDADGTPTYINGNTTIGSDETKDYFVYQNSSDAWLSEITITSDATYSGTIFVGIQTETKTGSGVYTYTVYSQYKLTNASGVIISVGASPNGTPITSSPVVKVTGGNGIAIDVQKGAITIEDTVVATSGSTTFSGVITAADLTVTAVNTGGFTVTYGTVASISGYVLAGVEPRSWNEGDDAYSTVTLGGTGYVGTLQIGTSVSTSVGLIVADGANLSNDVSTPVGNVTLVANDGVTFATIVLIGSDGKVYTNSGATVSNVPLNDEYKVIINTTVDASKYLYCGTMTFTPSETTAGVYVATLSANDIVSGADVTGAVTVNNTTAVTGMTSQTSSSLNATTKASETKPEAGFIGYNGLTLLFNTDAYTFVDAKDITTSTVTLDQSRGVISASAGTIQTNDVIFVVLKDNNGNYVYFIGKVTIASGAIIALEKQTSSAATVVTGIPASNGEIQATNTTTLTLYTGNVAIYGATIAANGSLSPMTMATNVFNTSFGNGSTSMFALFSYTASGSTTYCVSFATVKVAAVPNGTTSLIGFDCETENSITYYTAGNMTVEYAINTTAGYMCVGTVSSGLITFDKMTSSNTILVVLKDSAGKYYYNTITVAVANKLVTGLTAGTATTTAPAIIVDKLTTSAVNAEIIASVNVTATSPSVTITNNGVLTISGTLKMVYAGANVKGTITNNGTINVDGMLEYQVISTGSAPSLGTINAASYFVKGKAPAATTYYYTSLENAMTKSADITVYGKIVILKDTTLTGTSETSNKITIAANSKIVVGDSEDKVSAVLTLPKTTKLSFPGQIVVDAGQFVVLDVTIADYTTSQVNAEVLISSSESKIYTDLGTALNDAASGDNIKLRQNATIKSDAEVKSGVTLTGNNNDLIVDAGATFTVSGTVTGINNVTVNKATSTKTAGQLVLNVTTFSYAGTFTLNGGLTFGTTYDNTATSATSFGVIAISNGTSDVPVTITVNGNVKFGYAFVGTCDLVFTVAGKVIANDDLFVNAAEKIVISGTYTANISTTMAQVTLIGTGSIVNGNDAVVVTVTSKFISGTAATTIAGNSNSTAAKVTLNDTAVAQIYGTYDNTKLVLTAASGKLFTTAYYITETVLYATFTECGGATEATKEIGAIADPEIKGYNFNAWYSSTNFILSKIITKEKLGAFDKVYGSLTVKTVSVTVNPLLNGHWVINGDTITGGSNIELNESGNTIVFVADKDYKIEGTYTIYVGDKVMPADYVPQAGDVLSVTADIVKDEKEAGMDLVTILLIIITIVIIIMAIIIALKLMRS